MFLFVNLNAEGNFFTVDVPFCGMTVGRACNEVVGNNSSEDISLVAGNDIGNLTVTLNADDDVIGNVEVCIFTHCLNLADNFTDKALFNKFRSESCVNCYGYTEVGNREQTRFLNSLNKKIVGCQFDCADADIQRDMTVCVKLFLSL